MGGSTKIAIIDATLGTQGFQRQTSMRVSKVIQEFKQQEIAKPLVIKLPRDTVRACEKGQISGTFSYPENIEEQRVVIYCTADHHGGFSTAFVGTVTRVTRKNDKCYALKPERKMHLKEFEKLQPH
jgi:hypothetical protein